MAATDSLDGNKVGPRARLDWALIALLIGFLPAIFFAIQFSRLTAFSVLGISLLIAGASYAFGFLLGFLFGIPREVDPAAVQNKGSGSATVSNEERPPDLPRYLANTNLGQVSDWLTKILVGVGLTQIRSIVQQVRALLDYLAPGLGGVPHSQPFALVLLAYYLVGGFMMGYLWTSIHLPSVLSWRDVAAKLRERHTLEQERDDVGRELAGYGSPHSTTLPAETEVVEPQLNLADARSVADVAARVETLETKGAGLEDPEQYLRLARQLKRAGEFQKAERAYSRASELSPDDPLPLNLAGVLRSKYLGDYTGAAKLYFRALAIDPNYFSAIYNAACNEVRRGNIDLGLSLLRAAVKGDGRYRGLGERDSRDGGPFAAVNDNPEFQEIIA